MILIISDSTDGSTSDVIQWLILNKKPFVRINGEQALELNQVHINTDGIVLKTEGKTVNFKDVESVWYRRGNINFVEEVILPDNTNKLERLYLEKEIKTVKDYIHYIIPKKRQLNNYDTTSINKLKALEMAKSAGLLIPETIVTSHKTELKAFINTHKKVITKPAFETPLFTEESEKYYTSVLTTEALDTFPDTFFMSLFQNCLNKKYELRIFYFLGQCYSMAIFSQSDSQTEVDFRNYKSNKPNRTAPFKLTKDLEHKISVFMEKANLNCGSVDMVVTKNNDYVFLEVNPVGQFGMTSHPCNYKIEQKIANYL